MPLLNPLRRLSQYGAMAPVTPPFLPDGMDDEDAPSGPMGSYSASAEPPDLETPGQPEPSEDYPRVNRVNPLSAPAPSAASLGARPGPSAREQYEQLQTPVPPKTSIKRQLAGAALSAIPFVNKTTLPQDVAMPGYRQKVAEFRAKQDDLKRMTEQEDRQRKLDLEEMQKRYYAADIASKEDDRKDKSLDRRVREANATEGVVNKLPPGSVEVQPIAGIIQPPVGDEAEKYDRRIVKTPSGDRVFNVPKGMEVTEEIANSKIGKSMGLEVGQRLDPKMLNGIRQSLTMEAKQPNLKFEHFTNETNGDVTTIGFDPQTGEEKTRNVIKGVAAKRPPMSVMVGNSANDDTITFQAKKYLQDGKLPPSARNPVLVSNILNRATQLAKEQGMSPEDTGLASAAFKANQTALSALEKQANQINAFERTANKNLDLFLKQAKNVVDTGVVPLNQVFRGGNRMFGSGPQAAFDAARVTAFTEVSKVLSGSMSGVLSDSARREAESVLRGDYTLKQLTDVVALLKQDMANRKVGFSEQIGEIKKNMGGGMAKPSGGALADPLGIR